MKFIAFSWLVALPNFRAIDQKLMDIAGLNKFVHGAPIRWLEWVWRPKNFSHGPDVLLCSSAILHKLKFRLKI